MALSLSIYFFTYSFDWVHNFQIFSDFYLGIIFARTDYGATVVYFSREDENGQNNTSRKGRLYH